MLNQINLLRNITSLKHGQYWGVPTSSVDWCEVIQINKVNYEYTKYVAEFFNTFSSLAMAIVGLLGVVLHPWAETRFKVAFLATCVVGLGSVAFHATLLKASQAADEVPMLYSALAFAYITLNQTYRFKKSTRRFLVFILVIHSATTTYVTTAFEGRWQFTLFHLSFGTAQVFSMYQSVRLYRISKKRSGGDMGTFVFERGAVYYFSAFACWFLDFLACEFVNPHYANSKLPFNPQLHAWWHIFISLGIYNMALFLLYNHLTKSLHVRKPKVQKIFGLIDYIVIVGGNKSKLK